MPNKNRQPIHDSVSMTHPLPRQSPYQLAHPRNSPFVSSLSAAANQVPFEKSDAMRLLLQALQPGATNPYLEKFIHDVFEDECVVNAYFFPKCKPRVAQGVMPVSWDPSLLNSVLPLEAAGRAGIQAKAMKLIQPEERHLAQIATFVYPSGLFYLSQMNTVLGIGSPVPAFSHIDEMREMLLEDALHKLRSRHPGLGNTLSAVLGLSHDDDIDEDQVARIAAAVYLANVKVNAIWTEQEGKA